MERGFSFYKVHQFNIKKKNQSFLGTGSFSFLLTTNYIYNFSTYILNIDGSIIKNQYIIRKNKNLPF